MKRLFSVFLALCLIFTMIPQVSAQEATAVVDTEDVTLEGTDSLGTLLTEEILQEQAEAAQAQAEYSDEYCVLDLTFQSNVATVEYSTAENAILVVAVYTEDGLQLVTSGKTLVDPEQTTATVTVDSLPEYFGASAFLLDVYDSAPLCAAYYTPMYTQEMQELMVSTTDDYDAALVLNLDQSSNTNFAVYQENVTVIPVQAGVNTVTTVDNDNMVYVIENADENITNLQAGEVFAYNYADSQVLIAKVASVTLDGTTATVTGGDLEISEVFSHLKIEQTGDPAELEVDESEADEGITYMEAPVTYAEEGELKKSLSANFYVEKELVGDDDANVSLEGSVALDLDVTVSFYISASRQFVKFRTNISMATALTATGSVTFSAKLPKLTCNIYGIGVGFKPRLELEFSAAVEFTATTSATVGFSMDVDKGFKNLSKKPTVETDLQIEGTVFLGLDMHPTINILDGTVAELSLNTPIGFELVAKPAGQLVEKQDPGVETMHDCDLCIHMELNFKREIEIELQFLKCKSLTFGKTLSSKKKKICDLYFSVDNLEFGKGTCPYQSHLVTVTVTDSEGAGQYNAGVSIVDSNQELTTISTNEHGACRLYLPTGAYTFTTQIGDMEVYRYPEITESCKIDMNPKVPATFEGIYTDVVGYENVTDHGSVYASGECGENVTWALYASGLLKLSGTGATYDWVGNSPWYDVRQSVKAIQVEEGITYVGSRAFYHCYNATSLILADTVVSTGYSVFESCSALRQVELGNGLTQLGLSAFKSCNGLEEIQLPDSLQIFGTEVFAECSNLVRVDIPYGVTIIPKGMFRACKALTGVTIPETVTVIDAQAFLSCSALTAVELPEKLTTIGQSAFQACSALEYVNIPETVTGIGGYAFSDCSSLKQAVIPYGITYIAGYTFDSCTNLRYVQLPDTVTRIDEKAFQYCSSLTGLELPDALTYIGSQAFNDCTLLASLYFPETLATIEASAFERCSALSTLYFTADAPSIHSSYGLYGVTATAYYPSGNDTWTEDKLVSYGGTIEWVAYDPVQTQIKTLEYQAPAAVPALKSVFGGEVTTEVTETQALKTASFTELVPQGQYALLVVVSLEAEDMLAADNLLYINQGTADDSGCLSFNYVQREEIYPAYVMACGPSDKNLSDAVITFPSMVSDGQLQAVCPVVEYEGKVLTEGQDYVLVGNVSFTEGGTYTCMLRGIHNYAGLVKQEYTVLDRTMLDGWNLTLADQICMNFYMSLSDSDLESTQVSITLAGDTTVYTADTFCKDSATDKFIFKVPLAAAQMTEAVTVTVYAEEEITETKTYSVRQYADYILDEANGYDDVTRELVRQMLGYGSASQIYFDYNTDNLADAGIAITAATVPDAESGVNVTGSLSGVRFYGASLVYKNRIALRFYFMAENIDGLSFRIGDSVYKPISKDGLYYVQIENILPQELSHNVEVTVSDGTDSLKVSYAPLDYIIRMYSKGSDNTKTLVQALYGYHLAAKDYAA